MASATVDSASERLRLESIGTVDLRFLSQSDLYALSLCSDSAFDPRRCDDVVIPKIDRSVFNESAGSRKQTYSRLRLAPRKPESSTAAIPRRTPHLRAPKSATNATDDNDPERAENSRIIGLLKGLFGAETNGEELVPIRVDYTDSVPHLQNAATVGKRKRGRPRKNENLAAAAAEVVPVQVGAEGAEGVIKDIVVYETVDKDKEIVNKNGNVVDLAVLPSLEDPYGPELQRRTVNLKTDDELLGFLRGLNGQWGSRRKKKRIVEASEFGDALPRGWKLLLSLKKKEGHVWLFVRRYISPSGRQFVSCKEVSSYLLSLLGPQAANESNCGESNENIQFTNVVTCGIAVDLTVKVMDKRGDLLCDSSLASSNVSNDGQKLVISEVENSGEIGTGETLKCGKCPLTFNEKDDLLQHQLSFHRRKRSRFATSITDGVIIKGGKYECQFCHKTFGERNRYNGHVGAHIRHHMKNDEASPGVLISLNSVDPVSTSEVPPKKSMKQTLITDDCEAVTANANADNELKLVSSQSKPKAGSDIESYPNGCSHEVNVFLHDEQVLKSNRNDRNVAEEFSVKHNREDEMINCLGGVDEAKDVVADKSSVCLESVVAKSGDEIDGNDDCTANIIINSSVGHGRKAESCPGSPFANEKTCTAEIIVHGDPLCVDGPNQEVGSVSALHTVDGNEKPCGIENTGDVHFTSPRKRLKLETEDLNSKLIHGLCSDPAGPDEDVVTEGKQQNGSEGHSPDPVSNDRRCGDHCDVIEVSTSERTDSKHDRGSESSDMVLCDVKDVYGGLTSSVSKPKIDTTYNSGNKEVIIGFGGAHSGIDEDVIVRVEQENSESCLLDPSGKHHSDDMCNNRNEVSLCTGEEHGQERGSESSLHMLSGYDCTFGVKNDVGNILCRKTEERKVDEVRTYQNDEPVSGTSHPRLNTQATSLDFSSLVQSENGRTFVKGNMGGVSVCTGEESSQERGVESSLHILSGFECTFGVTNDISNISTRKMEEPKVDGVRADEPISGPRHPILNAQATSLEFGSLVQSENGRTFVKGNVTGVCNSSRELPEQKDNIGNGLFTQSWMGKTFGDLYIMNSVSPNSIEEPKTDEIRNDRNNDLILAFGNNDPAIAATDMNNVPIEQTFSFEANLSGENRRTEKESKLESDLLSSSGYAGTCADRHNFDRTHIGTIWERPMVEEVVSSGRHELTIGFGGSDAQPDGNVMPGSMWRTDEDNVLQATLAGTSTQQEQSSSCFPSFNFSDKGESVLLGINGKYGGMPGFEVAQSGHTEPVEFSFLTMQNLNSLPGDSKALSFNADIRQAFDSSFWLEKDALSLNIAARNQVASICVWCRNEFYHEPDHSGTQGGAIGSMCPTCSSKVSQQFNGF